MPATYIYLSDPSNNVWQIAVSNGGVLSNTLVTGQTSSTYILADFSTRTTAWQLVIDSNQRINTVSSTFSKSLPVYVNLYSPDGTLWSIIVSYQGQINVTPYNLLIAPPYYAPKVQPVTPPGTYYGPGLPSQAALLPFPIKTDAALIKDSITQILATRHGERLFEPEFGSDLSRLTFENDTTILDTRIRNEVQYALQTWEPRISIDSININHDKPDNLIEVLLQYHVISLAQLQEISLLIQIT